MLIKKIKAPNLLANDIIEFIKFEAETVIPTLLDKSVCQDIKNIDILGTVISIFTPRKFWEYLKSQS